MHDAGQHWQGHQYSRNGWHREIAVPELQKVNERCHCRPARKTDTQQLEICEPERSPNPSAQQRHSIHAHNVIVFGHASALTHKAHDRLADHRIQPEGKQQGSRVMPIELKETFRRGFFDIRGFVSAQRQQHALRIFVFEMAEREGQMFLQLDVIDSLRTSVS
jgi:hypothetical protein